MLDGATLQITEPEAPPRVIPVAEIAGVRLDFNPTRPEPHRYRCILTLRNGRELHLLNRTYAGIYDFRDTSPEYVRFIRQLHAALAQHSPNCRFSAGASRASYLFSGLCLVFAALAVIGALVFFVTVGLIWIAAIKVLLVLFFTPTAIKWMQRNQPRLYQPGEIPDDVLPR